MTEPSAASTKLIQYLNDAYGTEMRMETTLQAHIAMTAQPRYRKRLKEHLTETRRHGREVKQRIKQLGGTAETVSTPGPDIVGDTAQALLGGAQKAVALAQGPLHAIRGTGEDEKQLKNAKTEYVSESEEIATYAAIETLADKLGDGGTRQLAQTIRRDEERMRSFLEKEIPRLARAMAKAEIPTAERATASNGRTGTGKGSSRRPGTAARASAAKRSTTASKATKSAKAKRAAKPTAAKGSTKPTKGTAAKRSTKPAKATGVKRSTKRTAKPAATKRSTKPAKATAAKRSTKPAAAKRSTKAATAKRSKAAGAKAGSGKAAGRRTAKASPKR